MMTPTKLKGKFALGLLSSSKRFSEFSYLLQSRHDYLVVKR